MLVKTKGIVLTSLKYGDSDLIVKCLTEQGMRSYMLKRIIGSKSKKIKLAYFQPLSLLELTANHNQKGRLNSLREVRASYLYGSVATDIRKQSIALFLAEVLASAIREEESDSSLFEYVEAALIWLDTHDRIANFHLLFLYRLTRFLGFYPDSKHFEQEYFDLVEGSFSKSRPIHPFLEKEKLALFRTLIGINFDDVVRLGWNSDKRQALLEILLTYYEFHLPGFTKPRSLNVLKDVFNEIS
jgi:DNA repair protein RecO (recombination protein O)